MPNFSERSTARLMTCHVKLQEIFFEVVRGYDCSILCGFRDEEAQNEAYDNKRSRVKFPDGKHNTFPSNAVDAGPYLKGIGIDWNDLGAFYMFAGYVKRVAEEKGIKLRYGGDWDGDHRTKDQTFNDLVHFELDNSEL